MDKPSAGSLHKQRALSSAVLRACAVIAAATFAALPATASWAIGIGGPPQAEQAPKPAETNTAAKPSTAAQPKPSADELERWRQAIVHTKRPKKACFTATYPDTKWTEMPCGKPPKKVSFLPADGGSDLIAEPASGMVSWAEGSFDSVYVKGECGVQCPNGKCPANPTCTSSDLKNDFSLQLNSNKFATSVCGNHPKCLGWEQFIFTNRACSSGEPWPFCETNNTCPVSAFPACAVIQYNLISYGPNCPSGWQQVGNNCQIYSQNSVNFLPYVIEDLGFMKLTGDAAGVADVNDEVTFTIEGKAYSAPGDNILPELGQKWNQVEFNVLGDGGGNEAVFNTGTSLVVRIVVDSGTVSAPLCDPGQITSETNNLPLTELQTIPVNAAIDARKTVDVVSTQPGNGVAGPWSSGPGPALVFGESNASGSVPIPAGSCTGDVTVPGTPQKSPPGGGSGGKGVVCKAGESCCSVVRGVCQKCAPLNGSCP